MYQSSNGPKKVGVIIPCFKVRNTIATVVKNLPKWVDLIVVVDDACPERSAEVLRSEPGNQHLVILRHSYNQGVGGATISGFRRALEEKCDIIAKMDGDDQMDPESLGNMVYPIAEGVCDFTKGNRFFHLDNLRSMPLLRRIGNIGLTFLTKIASGHWQLADPTNGYIAIHRETLKLLNLKRLSRGYFFETSVLIQLNIIRAVAFDIPIPARYKGEQSSLNPVRAFFGFPPRLLWGLLNRVLWRYFFYDVNATTFCLLIGGILTIAGGAFGGYRWFEGIRTGIFQSAGVVGLSLLPTIVGIQLLLQALVLDVIDLPRMPICRLLAMNHSKSSIAAADGLSDGHQKADWPVSEPEPTGKVL